MNTPPRPPRRPPPPGPRSPATRAASPASTPPSAHSAPPRQRRSLTHVGGETHLAGDADDAAKLAEALDVPIPDPEATGDDAQRAHVHGFHTYPARMHPVTAARLVRAFVPARGTVLDPFCGSGTVLVEAMLAARDALGTDLNPLAVRLARCKTRPRSAEDLEQLLLAARDCAAFADERRKARAGATRRLPEEDVAVFDPHVLLELDSLRAAIERLSAEPRAGLSLVLSALLVKLSRKRGDTTDEVAPRRIAAGYTAKLFVKKTEELARRIDEMRRLLPRPTPHADVAVDDATRMRSLQASPRPHVDAIVTSPPYVGTYDYVAHHAIRLRWLGLDANPFAQSEMGARRRYATMSADEAGEAWAGELGSFFAAAARVLDRGAPMVLLMADSAIGRDALRADAIVSAVAKRTGFVPAALASQARPHFHGATIAAFRDEPRFEHALLLRRA